MLQRTRILSDDYFVATKRRGCPRANGRGKFRGDQSRLALDFTAMVSNRSSQRNLLVMGSSSCRTFREELFACPRVCRSGALAPSPQQMRGFPRPRPMGIRAGFSFGERQTFVGNPTDGPRVNYSGAEREAGWAALHQGSGPHADNRRPGSNSRPDRLLDSSAYNSVLLRNPSFSKQIDSPWR
jgi:hypothetical protein